MTAALPPSAPPPALRHSALLYDDDTEMVDRLVPVVSADADSGATVLVCLRDDLAAAIGHALGPGAPNVSFLPASAVYSRPVDAMRNLWGFTQRNSAAGNGPMHLVGEISFDGSWRDAAWIRYEAAVNEIFASRPLKASCIYDTRRCDTAILEAAARTHAAIGRPGGPPTRSGGFDNSFVAPTASVHGQVTERTPDLSVRGATRPAGLRHSFRAVARACGFDVVQRAELVLSELVTNAIRHGGGSADIDVWLDGDVVTVRVGDRGPGVADPLAGLRPPQLPGVGAGLWIANCESTLFDVAARPGGGTVVTAAFAPALTPASPPGRPCGCT